MLVLVASACQPAATPETAATTERRPATSTTAPAPKTTTTLATSSSTGDPTATTTTNSALTPGAGTTVLIPDGPGPFPTVVLVHGGGWVIGDPSSIQPLADFLTANGYLTVNTTYQLALQAPGFPTAVEDVACAVRFAASHPMSNGSVTVIGHSAGAHIGALVALTGSQYIGDCNISGVGTPAAFIGLAGPYDVLRLGPIMLPFFGAPQVDAPDEWDAGNPMLQTAANPNLRSLIIHGDIDQVVPPDFSEGFHQNLIDSGTDAELVILEGVDHAGAKNPSVVGELILQWMES